MKIRYILWLLAFVFIIAIINGGQTEEYPEDGVYKNSYLMSLYEEEMDVYLDGQMWSLSCPVGKDVKKEGQIVDITIENGRVKKVIWKEGMIKDRALAVNLEEGNVRLEKNGTKAFAEEIRIYLVREKEVKEIGQAGSLINFDEISFYLHEDKVHAIAVYGQENREQIRVLLHGTVDGIYHEEVRLTASAPYEVIQGEKKTTYQSGEECLLKKEKGEFLVICKEGKIRLIEKNGMDAYPEYRGTLSITKEEKGYVVVNELPLEEYLYSVVSSEMPSSYPEEALKAQAVCARTYALYQMGRSYYSSYGAHVDDTVNSQVYNNVSETEESKSAVKNTKGEYLTYDSEPIPAYFYSTSCGTTSDVADVWLSKNSVPVYLSGKIQGKDGKTEDLSEEKAFQKFIENGGEDCFEAEEPWFRWESAISLSNLTEHLMTKGYNPGEIESIQVIERSEGGVIKKLKVNGKKDSMIISGEYQIRELLCPKGTKIILQNGEEKSPSMLPSGYFYGKIKGDQYQISGGGYGHGVGLSQNGAKKMAEEGYLCEEILAFYYPETKLYNRY